MGAAESSEGGPPDQGRLPGSVRARECRKPHVRRPCDVVPLRQQRRRSAWDLRLRGNDAGRRSVPVSAGPVVPPDVQFLRLGCKGAGTADPRPSPAVTRAELRPALACVATGSRTLRPGTRPSLVH